MESDGATLNPRSHPARQEITPEEMRWAARAGALVVANTPGAPRGVSAPDGLPRVARLIGRDATLEATLAALTGLKPPAALALIGQAGLGKSALAAEVVARAAERNLFPGGVVWLACEGLSGDPGLEETLAHVRRALGDTRGPHASRALLALDHLEPALDAVALLDALTEHNVALLLTARRSLEDARLRDMPLAPLDSDAATDLYRQTLRQIDPTRPNAADEPLIVGVAGALGGSPLAIGLAAALAGATSWPLAAAPVSEDEPVAASLERTWEALPRAARRAFAGLALLEGATFPRGAALVVATRVLRQIAGGDRTGLDEVGLLRARAAETLDALIGLRLVDSLASGRLLLGLTIRHEAARRYRESPDDERGAPGEALAEWWLAFARAQTGHDAAATLAADAPGLMAALAWGRAHERPQTVFDLAAAVIPGWRVAGRTEDLRHALTWSVEAARALDNAPELRRALHDLALFDASAGRVAQARAGYGEALRLARDNGDEQAEALERHGLAALGATAPDED